MSQSLILLTLLSISTVDGLTSYGYEPLDRSIHEYSIKELSKNRTGTLVNVSLPANFSGIQVSAIRLRSRNFREKGVKTIGTCYIPPTVVPLPYVKRLTLEYQNLGKRSPDYYKMEGHKLVAPVVGLLAYDATNATSKESENIRIRILHDPIVVRFPWINKPEGNATLKCVKFGQRGMFETWDISKQNTCLTPSDGHYSVVVEIPKEEKHGNGMTKMKKIMLGFSAIFGVILLAVILVTLCKLTRSQQRHTKLEKEGKNESDVASISFANSELPLASKTTPNFNRVSSMKPKEVSSTDLG